VVRPDACDPKQKQQGRARAGSDDQYVAQHQFKAAYDLDWVRS